MTFKTKIWKDEGFGSGVFSADENGIALTLCLDLNNTKLIILWPIEISIDNLLPKIWKTCAGILIAGIIPGLGSQEPKSLEPYDYTSWWIACIAEL